MSVANTDPRAIVEALVSQLAVIDGTGKYHNDLSGSIIVGSPTEPPTTWPCLYVEPGAMVPDLGPAGAVPLGQFRCTFDVRLYAFVPVSTTGGSESTLQAYDAMMDILNGVSSSRTVGGTVHLSRYVGEGVVVGSDADSLGSGKAVAIVGGQYEWTRSLG